MIEGTREIFKLVSLKSLQTRLTKMKEMRWHAEPSEPAIVNKIFIQLIDIISNTIVKFENKLKNDPPDTAEDDSERN